MSKKADYLRVRDRESQADALFDSDWDELIIRYDPESRSYRVMRASDAKEDAPDKQKEVDIAKAVAADV